MSSRSRDELIQDMSTAMRRFMAHAVLFQDAVARRAGLHATDLQCAGLLVLDGPMTPSELAARTGLSTGGAITAVIDRLEKAALAERRRDDKDRRRVLVVPDEQAIWARVGAIYAHIGDVWGDYLSDLNDEQIALAVDILTRAAEINRDEVTRLRSLPPPPPPPERRS